MGTVKFRAGPFGGRSARHDDAFPPMITPLLYLPEPAKPDLPRDVRVPIQSCTYLHRSNGIYNFLEAHEGSVKSIQYCGLKRIQNECDWLRALVDPDQDGDRDGPRSASSTLRPPEVRAKKEAILPGYRRWLRDTMGTGDLDDDEAWAIFVHRTRSDLDWAAVGSPTHLDSVREILKDFFDISIPLG